MRPLSIRCLDPHPLCLSAAQRGMCPFLWTSCRRWVFPSLWSICRLSQGHSVLYFLTNLAKAHTIIFKGKGIIVPAAFHGENHFFLFFFFCCVKDTKRRRLWAQVWTPGTDGNSPRPRHTSRTPPLWYRLPAVRPSGCVTPRTHTSPAKPAMGQNSQFQSWVPWRKTMHSQRKEHRTEIFNDLSLGFLPKFSGHGLFAVISAEINVMATEKSENNSQKRRLTFLAASSREFFTAVPSHLSTLTGLSSIDHCKWQNKISHSLGRNEGQPVWKSNSWMSSTWVVWFRHSDSLDLVSNCTFFFFWSTLQSVTFWPKEAYWMTLHFLTQPCTVRNKM